MQDRPICFHCDKKVETNSEMVFEAPCGHNDCSSAVFHAICLFGWRERRQRWEEWYERVRAQWLEQHQPNDNERQE